MEVEQIAEICHEANRVYCLSQGDASQKVWSEAPWATRQSAIAGVVFIIENPDAKLDALHENWRQRKKAEGWAYGEERDELSRTHPCMVPYEELPPAQRAKDSLFRAIVKALNPGETHV